MCGGSGGSAPKAKPAPIAPAIVAPIEADTTVRDAGDSERKRRQAASGRSDTILTGGGNGLGVATLGTKRLLGE